MKFDKYKDKFFHAFMISCLATTLEARQLECSYDYVTHKTIYKITETKNDAKTLNYTFYHTVGSGGKEMWFGDVQLPTPEKKSKYPYSRMWGDMYWSSDENIPDIAYINFEKVEFYQIQMIDAYLKDTEKLPHGFIESNRMLEVPVVLWDCKRLD
jgi:hypothetical protein